jgi:type I site-specific restriction endonuclease
MTGFVVDVPGHNMLLSDVVKMTERTMAIDGTSRPIARNHNLDLPIINECHISSLRDMCARS